MLSFETTCAFFVASLLMAMTPGPDVIIVLTQSSLYGMRAGVLTTPCQCKKILNVLSVSFLSFLSKTEKN